MTALEINSNLVIPFSELEFATSRSGGPGGQNVNKLETKVGLRFDVARSPSLTGEQKDILREHLSNRIGHDGILRLVAQDSRSQWKNKELVVERFVQLLKDALRPRKKRKRTKPSKRSKTQRLQEKRIHSEKKRFRRKPEE